ncbi:MAG: DNA-binding protein [Succinivibrionaceae bacterium]|nr:DNA-binding protein [Succinivibrionaceae bacterium]
MATSDFAQKGEDGSPAASDDSPGKSGKKRRKRGPNLRIEEVAAAMERLGGDCSIDAVYAELGNHGSLSTITSMVSRIRAGDVPDRLLGLAQMPGILEARELGIRLVEFIYGRAREQFRQGREAAAAFALEVRDSCASESGALRSRIGELERDLRSLGDALAKERELRLRAEQDLVELRAELIAARAEARRLQAAIGKIASGTPAGTGIGGVLMALAGAGQEVGGD